MSKNYHFGQLAAAERRNRSMPCRIGFHLWNTESISPALAVRTCLCCGIEQLYEEPADRGSDPRPVQNRSRRLAIGSPAPARPGAAAASGSG